MPDPARNPYFPLRAAGFQCNPFRSLTVDEEGGLAVLPPAAVHAYDGSSHLQILGEMGRGKSALLLGLLARAEAHGLRVAYTYLAEGEDRLQTDPDGLDLFALDEAQRLTRRERDRLLERVRAGGAPRLVLTSHADLSATFARLRLPLTTLRLHDLGTEHVRAVLDGRLVHFALGDRPHATLAEDAHAWLATTFGDDLRSAIALLYEVFQTVSGPEVVDARRLRAVAARTGLNQSAPPRTGGGA